MTRPLNLLTSKQCNDRNNTRQLLKMWASVDPVGFKFCVCVWGGFKTHKLFDAGGGNGFKLYGHKDWLNYAAVQIELC